MMSLLLVDDPDADRRRRTLSRAGTIDGHEGWSAKWLERGTVALGWATVKGRA